MSDYTENYNLKKPKQTESYNVDDANSNNDIIDKTLFEKQDKETGKGLSTNDFTNLYKKKLDLLFNYDDTSIKKEIESLDERKVDVKDFEKLAEENEFLRENQLYGKTSGRNINLQDSAKAHVNLKLKGSTNQATRSGKNKLPYNYYDGNSKTVNGITFTVNEDKSITANGTATANAQFSITNPDNYAITAGSYKLVGENSAYTKTAIRGSYKKADGTIKYISSAGSFTIEEGATNFNFYVVILQGETVNNVTFYPMLLNSTETDLTFEAGGASPSPDYPSPIENVEGKNKFDINQEKEIFGIMLYKYSYYLKPNTKYTISSNCPASTTANIYANSNSSNNAVYINKNQTIQSDENGYFYILVRFKADASDNSTFNLYEKVLNGTYYIQLEKGTVATDYVTDNSLEIKNVGENLFNPSNAKDGYVSDRNGQILSANTKNKNTGYIKIDGEEKYFILSNKLTGNWGAWYDKDKKFISGIALGGKNKGIVTAPNNAYFINFTVSYENNNPDYANNVMIARSDKEIPYKPYQEQKSTFPLSEGQKLMEGSYLASDGIHYKRKQVVFDGSDDENWVIWKASLTNVERFYINLEKPAKQNGISLCSHFRLSSADSDTEHFRWSTSSGIQKQFVIFIDKSKATTVAELKTWLQSNPITVEYELLEEKIVPYTEAQQEGWNKIEQLHTYKNVTNIFSDAELDIVYVRDLQTVINNLLNKIDEQKG